MSTLFVDEHSSPLDAQQAAQLSGLLQTLSASQATWLSGYLSGLNAQGALGATAQAPAAQPAAAAAPAAQSAPAEPLTILYGSQTGNAEDVAEQLAERANADGLTANAVDMLDYKPRDLKKEKNVVVLVSTHGEGDPPDNAEELHEFVHGKKAPKLEGMNFSVLAFGDTSYEQFCQTGKDFDAQFEKLGANRVVDRVDLDVDFDDRVESWIDDVIAKFKEATGAGQAHANVTPMPGASAQPAGAQAPASYSRKNPFAAEVLTNVVMNGRGSDKEVHHIELDTEDSGLTWEPGDSLGIIPANDPDVVAMVGGKDYETSKFNRAVQARRQPGSTFKLIVYLAALQSGMTPDTIVDDSPITSGDYRPENAGGRYRGQITLRDAFAASSNVVAVKLYKQLGSDAIARATRSLGIEEELPANASVALGTAGVSLVDLTAAFAGIAADYAPVEPHALPRSEKGFFDKLLDGKQDIGSRTREEMRDLLAANITSGTGRAAALGIPAFGKTGTSQDSRDALFVGFAGDLVVGVWIGKDDNSSLGRASGGGVPARMWKDFMIGAIPGAAPRVAPEPAPIEEEGDIIPDFELPGNLDIGPDGDLSVEGNINGNAVRIGREGVRIQPNEETQRRLDQLDRRRDQIERAVEDAARQAEAQGRAQEAAQQPPRGQ